MSDSSSTSSPATSTSTLPSAVPSPQLENLTLHPLTVADEDKAESARLKAEANKAFSGASFSSSRYAFLTVLDLSGHDFLAAARLYSEAIAKNPIEPTLWCNRAYTRMKLEEYGYALSDASQCCTTISVIFFQHPGQKPKPSSLILVMQRPIIGRYPPR